MKKLSEQSPLKRLNFLNEDEKLAPQNSVSELRKLQHEEQKQQQRQHPNNQFIGKVLSSSHCSNCNNLNKHILYLENFIRSKVEESPCNSCSTSLSFLEYMKHAIQKQSELAPMLTEYLVYEQPNYYFHPRMRVRAFPGRGGLVMPKNVYYVPSKQIPLRRKMPSSDLEVPLTSPAKQKLRPAYSMQPRFGKNSKGGKKSSDRTAKSVKNVVENRLNGGDIGILVKKAKKKARGKAQRK